MILLTDVNDSLKDRMAEMKRHNERRIAVRMEDV
jgi:hypothetical protein